MGEDCQTQRTVWRWPSQMASVRRLPANRQNGSVPDPGKYFLQISPVDQEHSGPYAPAYLCLRNVGVGKMRSEFEYVGFADRDSDGRWYVSIGVQVNIETGSDVCILGRFDTRTEAIGELWAHRREAIGRHLRNPRVAFAAKLSRIPLIATPSGSGAQNGGHEASALRIAPKNHKLNQRIMC